MSRRGAVAPPRLTPLAIASAAVERAHHNGGMLASCPSRRLPASSRPSRGVCGWRAQSRSSCRGKTLVLCAIPPALLIDRRYLSHKYLASSWVVCMWSSFSSNGPNYLHQQLNRRQWCAPQPHTPARGVQTTPCSSLRVEGPQAIQHGRRKGRRQ